MYYYFVKGYIIINICNESNEGFFFLICFKINLNVLFLERIY